jgi:hypothetical protein
MTSADGPLPPKILADSLGRKYEIRDEIKGIIRNKKKKEEGLRQNGRLKARKKCKF